MSSTRYTATAIGLHWLIALLIFAAFGLGLVMTDIPGFTPTKLKYYSWHKWLGVTIFLLAVLRLIWRATHAVPALPASMPVWQAKAADYTHRLLYALMIAVPISGYLYSSAAGVPVVYLGVLPLPTLIEKNDALKDVLKATHGLLNYAMAALVFGHIAAALKHQFVDRDGLLSRMSPFGK